MQPSARSLNPLAVMQDRDSCCEFRFLKPINSDVGFLTSKESTSCFHDHVRVIPVARKRFVILENLCNYKIILNFDFFRCQIDICVIGIIRTVLQHLAVDADFFGFFELLKHPIRIQIAIRCQQVVHILSSRPTFDFAKLCVCFSETLVVQLGAFSFFFLAAMRNRGFRSVFRQLKPDNSDVVFLTSEELASCYDDHVRVMPDSLISFPVLVNLCNHKIILNFDFFGCQIDICVIGIIRTV